MTIIQKITIQKDQSWYWTEKWQKGEREAEEDIRMGKIKSFSNIDDLFNDLDLEDKYNL